MTTPTPPSVSSNSGSAAGSVLDGESASKRLAVDQAIHVLEMVTVAGLNDVDLRMLLASFGVDAIAELTTAQARSLLRQLTAKGTHSA